MHFVIQDNIHTEAGYDILIKSLDQFDVPYSVVKIVPFSHELIPDINPEGNVVVIGATTMSKIAKNKNWFPGSFINEYFDFEQWRIYVGKYLLNIDSHVCSFKDVDNRFDEFFIRPCLDSKTFSGQCFTYEEFDLWRNKVINLNETYTSLNSDTMVSYCPIKHIFQEYRFFVIDGKVITGSLYKQGSRVLYNDKIDLDIMDYAQHMVNIWQPARAFVIDIAVLENREFKIIEYNNLNSAGFYAADVQKLVFELQNMKF